MRSKHTYRGVPGVLGLAALILTGCPEADPTGDITCGPNTEEVDGKCVSTVDEAPCATGTFRNPDTGQCEPDVECGAGTTYNAQTGECEPDSVCGAGTTLNEATGECEPDVECGDDTTFDPSTGTCRPDVVCGDGTHFDEDSGECEPDENCGTGTTFDPDTQTCVPDLVCGPGLTNVDGVCLSALDIIVGEADAEEATPDANDPALGGTPESITIEAGGERTVFTGTIQRPVDLDGDEVVDQDQDVWRFTGGEGQMLRIRVVSTGAFQPAFTVTGPNGYYREPQVGFTISADRQVVLPYDGEYDITVLPSLVLQGTSEPIGDDDAVYAGLVEELEWPTPTTVALSDDGEIAEATGSLHELSDNFLALTPGDDAPVLVNVTAAEGNTKPVLLLFTGDGEFLSEVSFSATGGIETALTATYATVPPGLVAVLDWQTSNGIDVDFALEAHTLPSVDFGTVPVGETVVLPAQFVLGNAGISFTFEATAGQVVLSDFLGLSAQLTLLSPSGDVLFSGAKPFYDALFLAPETGLYRWVVVNSSASDSTASVAIKSFTPHDAGEFDGSSELSASFSGDEIPTGQRPGGEWFLVRNTAPAIARFDFEFQSGMPDLEVYTLNEGGVAVDRRFNGEDDPATLRAYRQEPSATLARLNPSGYGSTPDPWIRDWRVDVSVYDIPSETESEPNDTMDETNALPALPARIMGASIDDEIDLFTLTLDTPLQEGEAIVIDAENLTGTTSLWMRIREAGTTLEDDHLYQSAQVPLTRWMITPDDGPGPFVIELEGTGNNPFEYLLEVERVSANTDSEPNDTVAAPQDLGTLSLADLPFEIYGTTASNDADVFRLALDEGLPAGTALRVRAENLIELFDLRFAAYTAGGTLLSDVDHEDGVLLVEVPDTNPVLLEVKGESSFRTELYRIVIDVIGPVESEPNDTRAQATPLPALAEGESTAIWATEKRLSHDYFQINLDSPLTEGEALLVRWYNGTERGDIIVSVRDGADAVLAVSETYSGTVPFAPVGEAGPFYVRVTPNGSFSSPRQLYLLEVERVSGYTVESEPNDDMDSANALDLPAHVLAMWYDDDPDLYSVTLESELGAGEKLIVDLVVPDANDFVQVRVLDEAGEELAATVDLVPYLEVDLPVGTAGTSYFIEVAAVTSLFVDERLFYDMVVDIGAP